MNYKNNKAVSSLKALLLLGAVLLNSVCFSQSTINNKGYKIRIQIKGIADTVCYLANYFGDKTYLTDTAHVDGKGKFIFEGDTVLPGGIYIVAGQSNNKYFELIIDREQKFSAETDISDISGMINFENSPDNTLFFGFIEYNMKVKKEIELLRKREDLYADMPDSLKTITEQIKRLDLDLEIHQKNIVAQYPESFVAVLLKAMMDPEIKDIPVLENGREDSVYAFRQFKEHYWDNFNLSDDRLLRTPIFHKRLDRYFRDLVYQQPDSINREADLFINKTRANREVFKYVVWYLTYKYETSKIMGFDEIFVHMIDSYYSTGEAFWTDSATLKALVKHADALRPILIGKKAPELILLDSTGSFLSLNHVTAKYTVVFFYESDCSHCKKEIKELKDWYVKDGIGAEVFAVCTDTSLVKWKKFIRDFDLNWVNVNGTRSITRDYHDLYDINMTPALFVLDENKYIIAKRLKAEQLKTFLQNYHNNPEMHIKY